MKTALVTGGSRGIGRAICVKLAEQGYYVLVNYQSNSAAADETLQLIKEAGSSGEAVKFDVADCELCQVAIEKWLEANPEAKLEVLVNNAGIKKDNLLLMMTQEEWGSVLNTSLNGWFNVTKPALKSMMRNKYGRVVNVVSLSGIKGLPGQANYSAAKAGVIGATKALAQEIGRKGITVNAVAPGFINTDMTEGFDESDYKKIIPTRRFGEPEEVADLVCFLASEKAGYITGEVVSINGGLHT